MNFAAARIRAWKQVFLKSVEKKGNEPCRLLEVAYARSSDGACARRSPARGDRRLKAVLWLGRDDASVVPFAMAVCYLKW